MVHADMSLRIAPGQGDFTLCTREVEKFAETLGLSPKLVYQLTLVLDELITNIISYGYDTPGCYTIDVQASCDDGILELRVVDDARPFNPITAQPPELDVPLEDRAKPVGGMGIHLVKSLMDSVDYQRKDGKNMLFLRKNLALCLQGKQ